MLMSNMAQTGNVHGRCKIINMNIERAEIAGVVNTPLREIKDERGAVLHMLRCDADDFSRFGECYFSEVAPGAVKAWKRHVLQTQNIAVPVGRIRLVIYDDRQGSATKNNILLLELGRPDAYQRVQIPPGLWYGFACLSDSAALVANCADQPHAAGESEIRNYNDPAIPYSWDDNLIRINR